MRSFLIFTGKEITEHIRSWRLVILGAVFILFGIMSPATAKYMPEILKMAGGDTGLSIILPPVTVMDCYLQFFKNINGIGMIVILLVFAGLVAGEKSKGSASLILTKNLSRPAFLMAKFTAAALLWTIIYACGALVCQGYTLWFFQGYVAPNLFAAFAAYWLYGLVLIALTMLASALAGGYGIAALGAFAGWGLMMLSMVPAKIARYSPAALGSVNLQVIAGGTPTGDLLVPAIIAVALIALALSLASWSLSKQEL